MSFWDGTSPLYVCATLHHTTNSKCLLCFSKFWIYKKVRWIEKYNMHVAIKQSTLYKYVSNAICIVLLYHCNKSFSAKAFRRKLFGESFGESFSAKAFRRKLFGESFSAKAFRRKLCGESFAAKALRRKLCGESFLAKAFWRKLFDKSFWRKLFVKSFLSKAFWQKLLMSGYESVQLNKWRRKVIYIHFTQCLLCVKMHTTFNLLTE